MMSMLGIYDELMVRQVLSVPACTMSPKRCVVYALHSEHLFTQVTYAGNG